MQTYEFRGYSFQNCVDVLNKWLQSMVTEICQGNIVLYSAGIEEIGKNDYGTMEWHLFIGYTNGKKKKLEELSGDEGPGWR